MEKIQTINKVENTTYFNFPTATEDISSVIYAVPNNHSWAPNMQDLDEAEVIIRLSGYVKFVNVNIFTGAIQVRIEVTDITGALLFTKTATIANLASYRLGETAPFEIFQAFERYRKTDTITVYLHKLTLDATCYAYVNSANTTIEKRNKPSTVESYFEAPSTYLTGYSSQSLRT